MSITIELGWWLAPFAFTVASFLFAVAINRNGQSDGGWSAGLDGMFSLMTYLLMCVVPSLIAWLVWSILR